MNGKNISYSGNPEAFKQSIKSAQDALDQVNTQLGILEKKATASPTPSPTPVPTPKKTRSN